jgi:hypothetical protein
MPRLKRSSPDIVLWLCSAVSAVVAVSAVQTVAAFYGAGPDLQRTVWAAIPSWPIAAATAVLAVAGAVRGTLSFAARRACFVFAAAIVLPAAGFHVLIAPFSALRVNYPDAAAVRGVTRWYLRSSGVVLSMRNPNEPLRRVRLPPDSVKAATGLVRKKGVPRMIACAGAGTQGGGTMALRLDGDGAALGAAAFRFSSGLRRIEIENCFFGGQAPANYVGLVSAEDVQAVNGLIDALGSSGWPHS